MKRDVLKYESLINDKARLSDIDFEMVDKYRQNIEEKLGIKINPSAIDILQSYGCIIKDKAKMSLNNAAILLFSKTPQKFFPHSMITCVDFRNKDILRKDIYGNLFNLINNTMHFLLESLLNTNSYVKSILSDEKSYDKLIFIIRESLINAISHRDYSLYGERTFLFIFDDYIEIINPGSLITFDLKINNFSRKPRNIIIHNVLTGMYYDGLRISGKNMINHFCKEIKLKQVEFSYIDGHFKSILCLRSSDNIVKGKYETAEIPYIHIPQKGEQECDEEFPENDISEEECDGEFTEVDISEEECDGEFTEVDISDEECDGEFTETDVLIEKKCDGEIHETYILIEEEADEDNIFPHVSVSDISSKNNVSNISQREKGVIDYLHKNSSITRIDCEELLKIEPRTANRVLKSLVEKGFIEKEGSGTNFYYVLVK
jgi:predicted HTH transcriptional regulator